MQLAPLPAPQLFQTQYVTSMILEFQHKVTYCNIKIQAQESRLLMIEDIEVSKEKWENVDNNLSELDEKYKEEY